MTTDIEAFKTNEPSRKSVIKSYGTVFIAILYDRLSSVHHLHSYNRYFGYYNILFLYNIKIIYKHKKFNRSWYNVR